MKKVLYSNFNLIDGHGNNIKENSYMMVQGERILEIGVGPIYEFNGDIVDCSGKFIMPGLINSHVHITYEPIGEPNSIGHSESFAKAALRGSRNLQKHLHSGTTFLRSLGTDGGVDLDLRDSINEGIIDGAELICSGKVITMTGGHGWANGIEADGCDETRKAARSQLKAGADVIKIMATGGVMTKGVEPGSAQLSMEEMKSAIEEAHKAGRKTATHAQGTEGIKNAILAGIDSIEHGIFLDEETINLMISKDTYLVPTLSAPYFIVENGIDGGIRSDVVHKAEGIIKSHFKSFKMAYDAGVKIAMGNDAGTPFNQHTTAWMELKLMIDAGMDPMDAIITSTYNSADLLDILEDYGTIEVNKFADFLILDENPLENIETLANINSIYKKGKLIIN